MKSRINLVLWTLVGGLLLAGCMTLSQLAPPDVSLTDLRFESASLFETTAVFTARVLNESPEPFTFTGGVFTISLNGSRVGKGVTRNVVEVPAFSSVTMEIPVYLNNVPLLFQGMNVMRSEEVRYGLEGTLYVKTGRALTERLRVAKTGQFKLSSLNPPPPVPAKAPLSSPATGTPGSAPATPAR